METKSRRSGERGMHACMRKINQDGKKRDCRVVEHRQPCKYERKKGGKRQNKQERNKRSVKHAWGKVTEERKGERGTNRERHERDVVELKLVCSGWAAWARTRVYEEYTVKECLWRKRKGFVYRKQESLSITHIHVCTTHTDDKFITN